VFFPGVPTCPAVPPQLSRLQCFPIESTAVDTVRLYDPLEQELHTHQASSYHPDTLKVPMPSKGPANRASQGQQFQAAGGESTLVLLLKAQQGDPAATEQLFERCLPRLRRWATGRLPGFARELVETDDLVQDTCFRALKRLPSFEVRHEGALQAYLRQALLNRIRDEIRRATRHPANTELDEAQPAKEPSPLELAIGRQDAERYEAALATLRPQDREAIVGRIELQCSYDELAVALGKPTANAARVAVTRALGRLIKAMGNGC
jgi:RNA polymerase sigma factor (sigma-70 family)